MGKFKRLGPRQDFVKKLNAADAQVLSALKKMETEKEFNIPAAFERIFGFKPYGHVTLQKHKGGLVFTVNVATMAGAVPGRAAGVFVNDLRIRIPELKRKVALVLDDESLSREN